MAVANASGRKNNSGNEYQLKQYWRFGTLGLLILIVCLLLNAAVETGLCYLEQ